MTANDRDAARGATESDVHAPGALGDVPPVSGARLARYAEAMFLVEDDYDNSEDVKTMRLQIERVVAVADAEQTELKAEVERLTRWKSEATEVILGLQDLGRALELPLGERITGEAAAEAARTLKAEVERLRAALTRAEEADQQTIHMYSAAMVRWNARAESAEAALTSEREAHSGQRARLEALAEERDVAYPEKFKFGAEENYVAGYRAAQADLRRALAAEPAAPVAAEEGGEQEAGEATNGPLPECEHGVPRHYGCAQCIAAGIAALANGPIHPAPSRSDDTKGGE